MPFVQNKFSELFSVVFWDIYLKFCVCICLDVLQINFDFCRVWLSFTWVIALCSKLVFRTFLSCLLKYLLEILCMHLSWCLTDKVWLLLHLTYIYMSYCPLFKFIFTDFSQLSLEIFNLWVCICLVVLQIKFDFCHVWPTFTWVIILGSKLVFQTFLSCHLSVVIVSCFIYLKFCVCICLDVLQIKFDFCYGWVITLSSKLVFQTFQQHGLIKLSYTFSVSSYKSTSTLFLVNWCLCPRNEIRGHLVFGLSVCYSVCLWQKTLTLAITSEP